MASFNRVVLVGNLTRDPELRYLTSGMAVSDIGLAVNERYKKNDQWVEDPVFVDVTLWGRTAEVANEYLSKGSPVLIEGRLKLDRWEKDGQKHSKLKVTGEKMQMLSARGEGGSGGGRPSGGGSRPAGRASGGGGDDAGGDDFQYGDSEQFAPVAGPPPSDDIPF